MSRPRPTTTSSTRSASNDSFAYPPDAPQPRRRGTDTSMQSNHSRYSEAMSDRTVLEEEEDGIGYRGRNGGFGGGSGHVGGEWPTQVGEVGATKRRKRKDEPMSPVLVVFYVTALYLIFQLLTRSDDLEILSHLPQTSSLRGAFSRDGAHSTGLGGSNLHSDISHHPYQMPYHLPHIPSPMPNSSSPAGGVSIIRLIGGVLFYPIYLIFTLLAVPIPLLLNVGHVLFTVLGVLLYPLTSTLRLILHTFVLAPLAVGRSVLDVFWPIIAFVGAVVGVGCFMGLVGGWVGKWGLDWVDRKMRGGKKGKGGSGQRGGKGRSERSERSDRSDRSARKRPERSERERAERAERSERADRSQRKDQTEKEQSRSERSSRSTRQETPRQHQTQSQTQTPNESPSSDSGSIHEIVTPPRRAVYGTSRQVETKSSGKERAHDSGSGRGVKLREAQRAGFEDVWNGIGSGGKGTAREGQVLGTRKRGHVFGDD